MARAGEVLETPYAHVIFTLPHDLGALALQYPRQLYGLLFRTVAQTLQDIAGDPQHLGAEIGGFAVLHTWGQQLHHHPHLHGVLPAGGLALDSPEWVACRPHCFLPVRVLSRRFRRLYLAGLEHLYGHGQLSLAGRCRELSAPPPWRHFLATLRDQEWVVFTKEPMQHPRHVLKYLARYTHRVAISNHRLVSLEDGQITFRYKVLCARPPPTHPDTGCRRVLAAADAPCAPTRVPQNAALRLPGQPCATGETRPVPRAAGAWSPTLCPGKGRGSGDIRDPLGSARRSVSGLPTRPHATGRDAVSTAGGMGPVCARPQPGHLIEEGGDAARDQSLPASLDRLDGYGASTAPGTVLILHKGDEKRGGVMTDMTRLTTRTSLPQRWPRQRMRSQSPLIS